MSLVEFKSWWGYWSGSDKLPENTDIRYAFEAGQQSQQGEVDKLQTKIDLLVKEINETQAFLNKQNHVKQTKIDELNADFRKVGMSLATAAKEAIIWMDKSKKSDFTNQELELHVDKLQARIDIALALIDTTSYSEIERRLPDFIEQLKDSLKGNKDEK